MVNRQFSPRAVGFDGLFDALDRALGTPGSDRGYPPHNLIKSGEDGYSIQMALAGFRNEEVSVDVEGRTLTVKGTPAQDQEEGEVLHRGISRRAFERRFLLAEHIEVEGAALRDGMLVVTLRRVVPESARARRIEISGNLPAATAG